MMRSVLSRELEEWYQPDPGGRLGSTLTLHCEHLHTNEAVPREPEMSFSSYCTTIIGNRIGV